MRHLLLILSLLFSQTILANNDNEALSSSIFVRQKHRHQEKPAAAPEQPNTTAAVTPEPQEAAPAPVAKPIEPVKPVKNVEPVQAKPQQKALNETQIQEQKELAAQLIKKQKLLEVEIKKREEENSKRAELEAHRKTELARRLSEIAKRAEAANRLPSGN